MRQIIWAVVEIILLGFKNALERNAEKKKANNELLIEAKEAVKSGDASRITSVFDKLRRK